MRFIRRLILFTLLFGVVGGAMYVQSAGFSVKWRAFVMEQFESHGIHLELDRLMLDPLEGIVARNIRVYAEKEHRTLLAVVDRLNLELDYSKAWQREVTLESLDLRKASLQFPIDPDDPKSETLALKDLNARLFLVGDRVEIRKADGDLYGLRISVTGSLLRPPPHEKTPEEEAREAELRRKRLALLKARRQAIIEVARALRHFETARAPTLMIEVNGDLEKPEELNATLHLSAGGLRHGTYKCDELEAVATYADESIDLTRLYLKDHLGDIEASASHVIGSETIDFHLRSSADLPALASAILEQDALHEVVFYEPFEINADGQYLFGKASPKDAFVPVRCTGTLHAGRFASRGEIIDSLALNFGLAPEGIYLRDLLLRHKTGTLGLKAMWKKDEGLHYKALLQMDPNVFMPFAKLPQTKAILKRFEFSDETSIFAEISGESPTTDIHMGANGGRVELHNFKYRGTGFKRVEANVSFTGETHTYRNLVIERPEGNASADEVHVDDHAHTVKLTKVVSEVDPVALVSCFAQDTADVIARYRFDRHPHAEVDGTVATEGGGSNVHVKFRGPGVAHYMLWGEDYTVSRPTGDLVFNGPLLAYDITGSLFGKDMQAKGNVDLSPMANDYTVNFKAGLFPYEVFGKPLPFGNVVTKVVCKKGFADFDVKAKLFDGSFSLKGRMDDNKQPQPYTGELRVDAISFNKFARVYSPEFDTEGDLTGHTEFTGKLNDWKSLKGKGAVVILNSNLYAVPILGPLTPLLAALLPTPIKGFNVAKSADATFVLDDGFLTTDDLEALTAVFRLVVKGKVDYLEDRIFFHAQAKFRGLPGLVLFPVSEILEYTGEGTVGTPVWRPRYFSTSSEKKEFRKSMEPATPGVPDSKKPGESDSNGVFRRSPAPTRVGK